MHICLISKFSHGFRCFTVLSQHIYIDISLLYWGIESVSRFWCLHSLSPWETGRGEQKIGRLIDIISAIYFNVTLGTPCELIMIPVISSELNPAVSWNSPYTANSYTVYIFIPDIFLHSTMHSDAYRHDKISTTQLSRCTSISDLM